jgi:hypothetical protein
MTKVLDPRTHGILDYALAVAFLIMPALLGFSDTAARLSYAIGALYIAVSLLTQYPLGAFKVIPFPVHGVLESIMAAAWIAMPWLLGFAEDTAARNFFIIAGVGLLAVAALTDYNKESYAMPSEDRRHSTNDRRKRSLRVAQERRMATAERRGYAPIPG